MAKKGFHIGAIQTKSSGVYCNEHFNCRSAPTIKRIRKMVQGNEDLGNETTRSEQRVRLNMILRTYHSRPVCLCCVPATKCIAILFITDKLPPQWVMGIPSNK